MDIDLENFAFIVWSKVWILLVNMEEHLLSSGPVSFQVKVCVSIYIYISTFISFILFYMKIHGIFSCWEKKLPCIVFRKNDSDFLGWPLDTIAIFHRAKLIATNIRKN